MHVQVAAHIGQFNQMGKLPAFSSLNLAAILPQLGTYPGQPHRPVDACFVFTGHSLPLISALLLEHPVFVDGQTHLLRPLAQRHVVISRTSEILQRCTVAGGFNDSQVHLPPSEQAAADLGLPSHDHLGQLFTFTESSTDLGRPLRGS